MYQIIYNYNFNNKKCCHYVVIDKKAYNTNQDCRIRYR